MTTSAEKTVPREDLLRRFKWWLRDLYSHWLLTTYPFAECSKSVSIHYTCDLSRRAAKRIKLGSGVELHRDVWINIEPPLTIEEPALVLEDGCVIGRRSQLSIKNSVHMERDVITGPGVLIMDHNHEYEDTTRSIKDQGVTPGGRIRIGEGSWIGHGAAIICGLADIEIGKHCVIAANSVVTRSFPAFSVIAGNPARVLKQFDRATNSWTLGAHAAPLSTDDASRHSLRTEHALSNSC